MIGGGCRTSRVWISRPGFTSPTGWISCSLPAVRRDAQLAHLADTTFVLQVEDASPEITADADGIRW